MQIEIIEIIIPRYRSDTITAHYGVLRNYTLNLYKSGDC